MFDKIGEGQLIKSYEIVDAYYICLAGTFTDGQRTNLEGEIYHFIPLWLNFHLFFGKKYILCKEGVSEPRL